MINNHKTQGAWKIHSGITRINRKTQSEWKIQLTMAINFASSLQNYDEARLMHARSDNIETMIEVKQKKLLKNFLNLFR